MRMALSKQLLAFTLAAFVDGVVLVGGGGEGGGGEGGGGGWLPLKAGCTLTAIFMPPRQWPGIVHAA
jgi:hypothetical protein